MINITIKVSFRDGDEPARRATDLDVPWCDRCQHWHHASAEHVSPAPQKQITMQRAGWFARWFGLRAGEYR